MKIPQRVVRELAHKYVKDATSEIKKLNELRNKDTAAIKAGKRDFKLFKQMSKQAQRMMFNPTLDRFIKVHTKRLYFRVKPAVEIEAEIYLQIEKVETLSQLKINAIVSGNTIKN